MRFSPLVQHDTSFLFCCRDASLLLCHPFSLCFPVHLLSRFYFCRIYGRGTSPKGSGTAVVCIWADSWVLVAIGELSISLPPPLQNSFNDNGTSVAQTVHQKSRLPCLVSMTWVNDLQAQHWPWVRGSALMLSSHRRP